VTQSVETGRAATTAKPLRRVLGSVDIAAFTASATTPLTVVVGVMTMAYAVTGFQGLPVAFVVIGAVLAVFCVGYVRMARQLDYAGAFYTYTARGLGRPVGVSAAWVALFSYNALQVGLYGFIGAAAAPVLPVEVPWWVVAALAWGIVSWMGLQRIKLSARILVVLLAAEIAVILLFMVTGLINPDGGSIATDTLNPAAVTQPGFAAALTIAVLGFIGFEATVTYIEEAKDPHRNVRTASYGVVAGATAVYVLGAWALSVVSGTGEVVTQSQAQGPDLMFNFMASHLGATVLDICRLLLVTSVVLAMISFHNTNNRYMYALAREGVLPRILSVTRAKTFVPKWASIVQSTLGAIVVMVVAASGGDPVTWLFYFAGTSGAIGVLLLLATASVAILAYFIRHPSNENIWRRIVAPSVATVALCVIAGLALTNVDVLLGVAPDSWLRWAVPAWFVLLAVGGAFFGVFLWVFNTDVYMDLGYAGKSHSSAVPERQPVTQPDDDPTTREFGRQR
jgi:amino acid transporter